MQSAQRQQKSYLLKKAIFGNYDGPPQQRDNRNQGNQPQRQGFFWRPCNQGNQGGGRAQAPRAQFPHRDPNAMDTSAGKATTEVKKKKHMEEGRCFFCSRLGHIARNCPNKSGQGPQAAKAQVEGPSKDLISFDEEMDFKGGKDSQLTGTTLAAMTLQLDEKERDAYVCYMQTQGEDLGF